MPNNNLQNLYKSGAMLMIILSVVGVLYAVNLFKEGRLIGGNAQNIISVSGTGKVTAKPDMSSVTLTIRETGKNAKEAQDKAALKSDAVLKSLKTIIDDKDIKTDSYSTQPNYVYENNSSPRISDYSAVQSITVKVRNTDNVSKVLEMISSAGINEVFGPNYTIDNTDIYRDQARAEAIAEAKAKAQKLADQLGVSLGRIVSFSESGDNAYPVPMYATMKSDAMGAREVSTAPSLPVGENEVNSNVTITFELK